MTHHFPHESRIDRWLKRIGRPRAYFAGTSDVPRGSHRAVPEPVWRSLLRKRGQPPPEGWSFRVEGLDPEGS